MEFLTAYYWQKVPQNQSSLLLQQGVLAKRRENVLFGCVADLPEPAGRGAFPASGEEAVRRMEWMGRSALPISEAGYLTKQMQEWYRREALPLLSRTGAKSFETLKDRLTGVLERTDAELGYRGGRERDEIDRSELAPNLAGCLFVEERCFFFFRGRQRIYLLNDRFARSNSKRLTQETAGDKLCFLDGTAQPGVGLLLATEPFCAFLGEDMIRDCLALREIGTEERAEKRLGELGKAAVKAGAGSPCALYLLAGAEGGAL